MYFISLPVQLLPKAGNTHHQCTDVAQTHIFAMFSSIPDFFFLSLVPLATLFGVSCEMCAFEKYLRWLIPICRAITYDAPNVWRFYHFDDGVGLPFLSAYTLTNETRYEMGAKIFRHIRRRLQLQRSLHLIFFVSCQSREFRMSFVLFRRTFFECVVCWWLLMKNVNIAYRISYKWNICGGRSQVPLLRTSSVCIACGE